ncbi:MAG: hypothetical protein MUD16_13750 [Desulfobacterales bacterium]|jgi:hypothetical protein|nr:hypothetical protein [Desulfobacterales bacterium]
MASSAPTRFTLFLPLALLLFGMTAVSGYGQAGRTTPAPAPPQAQPDARQKELEREAAVNLSIARKSIQDDAFYNARVTLNVWKISALEAGTFDPKIYEELRKQLFDKSVRENLRCIEASIARRDAVNANQCLRIYQLHSQEIGSFDARKFEDLKSRVADIRRKERQR